MKQNLELSLNFGNEFTAEIIILSITVQPLKLFILLTYLPDYEIPGMATRLVSESCGEEFCLSIIFVIIN